MKNHMLKQTELRKPAPFWNPYLAGVLLGLTLLASYLVLGAGLGASAATARFGAWLSWLIVPEHTESSPYFGKWFADGASPMYYYLVFMFIGIILGGLFSAISSRRVNVFVERGMKASLRLRLSLALIGGVIVGFAARLAGGCTSGQALSGGALLLNGSLLFMGCVFIGGYATAWLVRRQWDD